MKFPARLLLLFVALCAGWSARASSHTEGGKRILVLVSQYPDEAVAKSEAQLQADYDNGFKIGQAGGVDEFFRRNSYGKTWITEVKVRKVTLPNPKAYYSGQYNLALSHALTAAGESAGPWDRIMSVAAGTISSTGLAYVGGSTSFYNSPNAAGVAVHELGHNWGNWHANFWKPNSSDPLDGASEEYGNKFDNMSGSSLLDWNTAKKLDLDFLTLTGTDGTRTLDVTSSGTYRIAALDSDAAAPGAVRSLRFTRTGGTMGGAPRLYVDYRQVQSSGNVFSWNGVHVYNEHFYDVSENLIDMNPLTPAPAAEVDDAPLLIGRTFYDPGANVYITPLAKVAGTPPQIDVRVQFGPSTGNTAPTLDLSASNAAPSAGAAITLTATGNDPNGDALAFSWTFGDGTVSTDGAAVQTKNFASAGWYRVSCQVTDLRGGTATDEIWINVGAAPDRAPEGGATVSGVAYRYYEGTYSVLPDFTKLLPKSSGTVPTISLSPRQRNDNFAFVFDGFLEVATPDVYTLIVEGDDGFRLLLGGTVVLTSNSVKNVAEARSVNLGLAAGKHQFRLEFFHRDGAEKLDFRWQRLNQPAVSVPADVLGQTDSSANPAPVVTLTAPVDGAEIVVGGGIQFQADATDASGIATVQYYADGSFVGEASTPPYSVNWSNISVGTKSLVALAYDLTGRWAVSPARTLHVVSPEPRQSVGINFNPENVSGGTLDWSDNAGAVYQQINWNTLLDNDGTGGVAGSATNLLDSTGSAAGVDVTWAGSVSNSYVGSASNGDTSTAPGRLMKGLLEVRHDEAVRPQVTVTKIPYKEYDVYVYFDMAGNSGDNGVIKFTLAPGNGPAPAPIFGRNSASLTDSVGDYPNYDTWIGFKESTATVANDTADRLFGNYVVFRGVTGPSFTVVADSSTGANMRTGLNAVQIVESTATAPKIYVAATGTSTAVTEGGASDQYSISLGFAPTAEVVVTLSPDAQVAVDRTILTFTPENWRTPQFVTVSAVDDAAVEAQTHTGTITHAVSAGGNYAVLTSATPVTVTVADNDRLTVGVAAVGRAAETGPVSGTFHFVRSGPGSFAAPLTVNFQMAGSAALSGDYVLSGGSVAFDSGTGLGSVTIPAGSAEVFLTLQPVDDAVAEGLENASLTLASSASYLVGTGSALLELTDNEIETTYFQWFNTGQLESAFDLQNRTLTFTPDPGGTGYTAGLVAASAFPTATTGHTNLETSGTLSGSVDDGFWTVTGLPVKFFGSTYNTFYVATNGQVTFDSGDAGTTVSSVNNFFSRRRAAAYWRDLHPGTGGDVFVGRVTTPGQERTVVTFVNVARYDTASEAVNFQMEFFDDGKIAMTWLTCHPGATGAAVGLSNLTSGTPPGYREVNFSTIGEPVTNENPAPTFASEPPLTTTVGASYAYAVACADANGDTLGITAPTKPGWLTLTDQGNGTAVLTGTPPASGPAAVTLRVSDGVTSVDQSFVLNVQPAGGNSAPVFVSSPPNGVVNVGQTYTYSIAASDADGQALQITAPTKPAWLNLTDHGNGTATLTGVAPETEIVTFPVELAVTDGAATGAQAFALTLNRAPQVTLFSPARRALELPDRTDVLRLEAAAADPNGGAPVTTWTVVASPVGGAVTMDSPTALSNTASFNLPGRYTLRLTGSDGANTGAAELDVFVEMDGDSAVMQSGLMGYWKADETAGTSVLTDESGNGRTMLLGTGTNCVIVAGGVAGGALGVNGATNGYAENTSFTQTAKTSLSFWVRPAAAPAAAEDTVVTLNNGGNFRWRVFRPAASSRLRLTTDWGTTDGVWEIASDLPANAWTHVVIAHDNGTTTNDPVAYVNGAAVTVTEVTAPSGSAQSAGNRIRLAADASGATRFTGALDEVRVFSELVSVEDVTALFVRSGERTANLLGYWMFDDGIGQMVANDSGPSDRDLALGSGTAAVTGAGGYDANGIVLNGNSNGRGDVTVTQPNQVTVAIWFWNNSSPATAEENLWGLNNGSNSRLRVYRPANSRRLRVLADWGTTDGVWEIARDIPSGRWVHLAVAYDRGAAGNVPVAYLDGAAVPLTVVTSPAGSQQSAATVFRVGSDGNANNRWKGRLDEIRLYNRLVPADQVPLLLLPRGLNAAPNVDAGPAVETGAGLTVTLAGSATDDGVPTTPGAVSFQWTLVSGPAGAALGSPSSPGSSFTTGPNSGVYQLRLAAFDGEAEVYQTVAVTVPDQGGFGSWIGGFNGVGAANGRTDDPDGDGLNNLLEYALGGDPSDPDSGTLPPVAVSDHNGSDYLTIAVTQNPAASELIYTVEVSGDLGTWNSGPSHTTVVSDPGANPVIVRDNTPVAPGIRRYIRLKVTEQ